MSEIRLSSFLVSIHLRSQVVMNEDVAYSDLKSESGDRNNYNRQNTLIKKHEIDTITRHVPKLNKQLAL